MTWNSVGSIAVGPQDREVLVGSFGITEGDDTIWIRITQINPPDVWKYSFGLLTWKSDFGQELGTIKVYGDTDSEVYKLGVGLAPLGTSGELLFTPRAYNSRWISQDSPAIWSLEFEAQSGKLASGTSPDLPAFGVRATLGVLADLNSAGVSYAITGSEQPYALIKLLNQ